MVEKVMKNLTAVLILLACAASLHAVEPSAKPNIIFILSDDLSYRDLSCFGQEMFSTPHIDQLAMDA